MEFSFRGFKYTFQLQRDYLGNLQIYVIQAHSDVLLYQLTEEVSFPLRSDMVLLKDKPFIHLFLAELQKQGIISNFLQKITCPDGVSRLCALSLSAAASVG